jgi:hypothetical protein
VFIFFGGWWDVFYYVLNILVFVYKGACGHWTARWLAALQQNCQQLQHYNRIQGSVGLRWLRSCTQQMTDVAQHIDAGVNLPYLHRNFNMEFSFAWLWVLIEAPRLFLGVVVEAGSHTHYWPSGTLPTDSRGCRCRYMCGSSASCASPMLPPHAASKGNKTEHAGPLVFSFVLAAPLLAMYVYFIRFQTYV